MRKLQGINILSGDRRPRAVKALWQTSAVSGLIKRRMAGDSAAEIGLYAAPQAAIGSRVPAAQSQSEKYLRRMGWSKGR